MWTDLLDGRIWHGVRKPRNWFQLGRFALVGVSGYLVNLACFVLAFRYLGLHHLTAATWAFLIAVTNNFLWNRSWTFRVAPGRARFQAPRFLIISLLAFLFSIAVLKILVSGFRTPVIAAQAASIIVAAPLSFIGNKLWTFDEGEP